MKQTNTHSIMGAAIENLPQVLKAATTAKFTDTWCIASKIFGTAGMVIITKKNSKSFQFEGAVERVDKKGTFVDVKGTATFSRVTASGKFVFKCGSAVIVLNRHNS